MNLLFWKHRERYEDAIKKADEAVAETKRMKALLAAREEKLAKLFGEILRHENNGNGDNASTH